MAGELPPDHSICFLLRLPCPRPPSDAKAVYASALPAANILVSEASWCTSVFAPLASSVLLSFGPFPHTASPSLCFTPSYFVAALQRWDAARAAAADPGAAATAAVLELSLGVLAAGQNGLRTARSRRLAVGLLVNN